jgi:hypothetical protein
LILKSKKYFVNFFQTKTPTRIRFRESADATEEASLLSDTFDDDDDDDDEEQQQLQQQHPPQQQQQQQQQQHRVLVQLTMDRF